MKFQNIEIVDMFFKKSNMFFQDLKYSILDLKLDGELFDKIIFEGDTTLLNEIANDLEDELK